MAYKNRDDAKAACKRHYENNKAAYLERNKRQLVLYKASWEEYKSRLRCSRCGHDDPDCIEFHHRNPAEKEFEVSEGIRRRWGIPRILAEIAKCDPLCANCHRKLHAALRRGDSGLVQR